MSFNTSSLMIGFGMTVSRPLSMYVVDGEQ